MHHRLWRTRRLAAASVAVVLIIVATTELSSPPPPHEEPTALTPREDRIATDEPSSSLRYVLLENPGPKSCERHYFDDGEDYDRNEYDDEGRAAQAGWLKPKVPPSVPPGRLVDNNNFEPAIERLGWNVLFVGDSVGENKATFFEGAIEKGGAGVDGDDWTEREVLLSKERTGLMVWARDVPRSRGGGMVGNVRVHGFWHRDQVGSDYEGNECFKEPKNDDNGDIPICTAQWDPKDFEKLTKRYGPMDVVVYSTPWAWFSLRGLNGRLTIEDYRETVEVAHETTGAQIVILSTSSVNNNAVNGLYNGLSLEEGLAALRKDNEVIRTFVRSYLPPPDGSGVRTVLLLDWENLTDDLIVANAASMSIPPDSSFRHTVSEMRYIKPSVYGKHKFPQLTAMSCAGTTPVSDPNSIQMCMEGKRGLLTMDGMHWCAKTAGPRTNSGILCLMECAANYKSHFRSPKAREGLGRCETRCNAMFMNLSTVFARGNMHLIRSDGRLEIM